MIKATMPRVNEEKIRVKHWQASLVYVRIHLKQRSFISSVNQYKIVTLDDERCRVTS